MSLISLYLRMAIEQTIRKYADTRCVIVASSDMTHYEQARLARMQDESAIDAITAVEPEELLKVVSRKGISMCGAGPVAAMLFAAQHLGATSGKLIQYTHSGIMTGDETSVVGYAGLIITP